MCRIAVLLAILTPGVALADGMLLLPVTGQSSGFHEAFAAGGVALETDQRAVIVFRDGWETLVLQAAYATPSAGLAWIIPVSSAPRPEDVFLANQDFIEAAFSETEPIRFRHIESSRNRPNVSPSIAGVMPLLYAVGVLLRKPSEAPPLAPLGPGAAAAPPRAEQQKVTIHALLNLGPYRIAVLSALEGAALTRWLDTHGFSTPKGLPEMAEDYIARGWSFVAATAGPPGPPGAANSTGTPMPPAYTPRHPGAQGASLAYLPPLAITFATRQPVYPLKISRLGSPPVLCLRIVVLAPEGVWLTPPPGSTLAQEDLPVAVERMKTAQAQVQLAGLLGRGKRSEPRIFVDALRRKLAETADYRLLVCDARGPLEQIRLERTPERAYKVYSGPGASQQKTLDAVPLAAGRKLDTSRLYAARFWALLRREALDDLIFQCSPSPPSSAAMWSGRASEMPFVVKELASGYAIPTILAPYWFLAVPPVVMVCVLTVLIAGPMQRSLFGAISQESTPGQPSSARRGPGATAKAVLLFVALPAAAVCGLASVVDSLGLVVAASWPLWVLGTLIAPGVIWWECREAELARGTVLAIAVAVATWVAAVLAAPAVGVDTYRYANWATLACASQLGLYSILAGLLSGAFTEPRRPIRAWPLAAYIAVLVGTAGAGLETRLAGPGYSGGYPPQDLQAGRQEILSALSAFAFDNGALPRNLKDLTSVGPITEGLDSSGNTVRVNLPGGRRPYLQKLPLDPLSGRRDTWTYEPTGDLVVDSGAWGLVALETASLPAIPRGR